MDGQYQERCENVWRRRPNDESEESVIKNGGNCRHMQVYKTQGEMRYLPQKIQWIHGYREKMHKTEERGE